MPQPNMGSAGKPHVSQPIQKPQAPAPQHDGRMFGAPGGKGTRGK